MVTGQGVYQLCLAAENYTNVYQAFKSRAIEKYYTTDETPGKEAFQARRERTRQQRIKRYL